MLFGGISPALDREMTLTQTQRRGGMDKKDLKKLVTSLGLAGLMAGATVTLSAGPVIGGRGWGSGGSG